MCQAYRCISLAFCCWIAVVSAAHPAETGPNQPATSEKKYQGLTLSEWYHRLGEFGPTSPEAARFVPGLLEIVRDRELPSNVRERFAVRLGRIGKPARDAVPVLIGIIQQRQDDPDPNYIWAARALSLMGREARLATPALVDLLFDEQLKTEYRLAAIEALTLIGPEHPDAIPALMRLLQYQPSHQVSPSQAAVMRQLAAEAFAIIGPEAAIAAPLLIRAVRNPRESEAVRRNAVIALGTLADQGRVAIPVLCEELESDNSAATRDAAAQALAKIGEDALPMLRRYLQHEDPEVRWRIAHSLGQLAADRVSELPRQELLDALVDDRDLVRISAAESLWKLGFHEDAMVQTAIGLLSQFSARHPISRDESARRNPTDEATASRPAEVAAKAPRGQRSPSRQDHAEKSAGGESGRMMEPEG